MKVNLSQLKGKITAFTLLFLSALALVWLFSSEWKSHAVGLALGSVVAYLNMMYLAFKVDQVGGNAAARGSRRMGTGFATRAALAILAAMLALKVDEISLLTTIVGIMVIPVFLIIYLIFSSLKHNKSELERGEK
ncbi:ATP synthase subunit I [Longirhabdus pacifica]|uniref:ATP synthase subunit I n=1 Tax=Longirhabdus pacifica TaxID=2305227 RepID=UPI001008D67C|nr:ATP synthase subunit I [Longirhabdus pacifica]